MESKLEFNNTQEAEVFTDYRDLLPVVKQVLVIQGEVPVRCDQLDNTTTICCLFRDSAEGVDFDKGILAIFIGKGEVL
jgi:hypothetical protein